MVVRATVTESTDQSDRLLLSPLFIGALTWTAAIISFGHREVNGEWPAQLGGAGAALFVGLGVVAFGYALAARVNRSRGAERTGE